MSARHPAQPARSLKLADWPYFDRILLERALACGVDLLDDERGPATHWSEATRRKRVHGYGAWLAFLLRRGWLAEQVNPRARVTPATLRCYVEELQASGYASLSVWNFVDDLDAMLRAMLPDEDWSLLRRAAARLKARSHRTRSIEPGLPQARELYRSGVEAMREVETGSGGVPVAEAIAYRDGLAVALLAACPLRRRTFSNLILGQHLVACGDGFTLHLEPRDLKNSTNLKFPLPMELGPWLRRYLEVHRPRLAPSAEVRHLWADIRGTPLVKLADRVEQFTAQRFTRRVPMQHFRHAAATGMAMDDPHHVHLVAALLGHSRTGVGERYYNLATALEAGRAYQQGLLALHAKLRADGLPQR
jgi:integrase